ncbi:hypothetical protein IWX90DRAFT_378307 [Phyllosticta citrichinensis]|uniref:DUF1168-domain-containing protein n=1 Tax=Phyllosticta citrichinensis TaxID=1130410 RepID=A0ABR1Y8F6_9PEZI
MSEPIPESVPTSADPRTHRPTKKRALSPATAQANQLQALFKNVDKEVNLPNGPKSKKLAAPPEIVANVQGSSAGAGSGEFHVYKASRRREYERLRMMDEEKRKEDEEREFAQKREEMKRKDEAKTNKNKARREKAKARKQKKKDDDEVEESGTNKLGPNVNALKRNREDEQEVEHQDNPEEIGIVIHDD